MIDLLTPHSRDIWSLAHQGKVDRLRRVLEAEPQRARELGPHGTTPLWFLPKDERVALDVVELLLAYGVDPSVKMDDGTTAADSARALRFDQVAQRIAFAEKPT